MAEKLMYIPNYDTQNYSFYKLVVESFRHLTSWTKQSNSIKAPKVVNWTNKKTLSENFGGYYDKQPNVPYIPVHMDDHVDWPKNKDGKQTNINLFRKTMHKIIFEGFSKSL